MISDIFMGDPTSVPVMADRVFIIYFYLHLNSKEQKAYSLNSILLRDKIFTLLPWVHLKMSNLHCLLFHFM